jgi:hypothetical protein
MAHPAHELTLDLTQTPPTTLAANARARRIHWILRLGAAACFIGHGAFGIITKAAWVPYFSVVGIGPDTAYTLMPVVGTVDILMGVAVLFSPRPFVLLYMAVWALWTALLRPLSGEPVFETLERAGNYGVPLAMLLLIGWPTTARGWFTGFDGVVADARTIAWILRVTTALLLFGHGALQAITGKAMFAAHYAALGLPATAVSTLGAAEVTAAVIVLFAPTPPLLVGIAIWKLATEALFPISGAPIWEFIERGGSYAAPLALALLSLKGNAFLTSRGNSQ